MTEQELKQITQWIKEATNKPNADENIALILKLAGNSFTEERLKLLTVPPSRMDKQENKREENFGILTFTKKELSTMPKSFQHLFAVDSTIVKYRYYQGLFQARYRRNGFNIEVASKDFETMKRKFTERLIGQAQQCDLPQGSTKKPTARTVLFGDFVDEWLKIKKQTTKPSTYAEYERLLKTNLKPRFGHLYLSDINRPMIQSYLFEFVEQNKHRTADKLKLLLRCIFDLAADDYGIQSPVKKIVLPYHESKKGSAFTKAEERKLVDYCIANPDSATTSALLVLLYFGLRQSELASLRVSDGNYLECETSKERLGRKVSLRRIPFTPVFKRVLPYVDFEKAKNTVTSSIGTMLKRLFPNHHPHELRYTFITRCKECGVNPEVVMLWDGHTQDKDIRTSKVDRGYTDYSEEYLLKEAEKVNYEY